MPGDLQDENVSNNVGYYERRYQPTGEWNDPGYGTTEAYKELKPGSKAMTVALKSMREDGKGEVKRPKIPA
jgi:hypothetical protein